MFVNHAHLMPSSIRPDATADVLLRMMDCCELDGAVCFAPFSYQMKGEGIEPNLWLAEAIRGRAELVGFGTLDPARSPGEQVRRISELGFRGIKLHPAAQGFELVGQWAMAAYEAMAGCGLVADFHTGVHHHRLRECNVLDHDEIAVRFPNLPQVFEHVGGWHFHRQMLAVITNNVHRGNRLYAGITSVLDRQAQRYWYLGPEGLADCRWQIGADLLIYGLDFPYNQREQTERDLQIIRSLDWPAEDTEKLLGRNLRRLLGLEPGRPAAVGGDPNPTPR